MVIPYRGFSVKYYSFSVIQVVKNRIDELLTEQKMKGVAVVYVGEDLDVLLELCDRIVVLCGGQVSGVVDARKTDKREVGALMTLVRGGNKDE